ncbi:hypothetical protein ACPOL_6689 [Acidisarcina polymorpha]|uniref:Uncharacterized protein n=1 Tax=Acidisarcina polymorpha TaxID=2211140 RepID=A0A2Z5G9S2_9BACT|nr:hypothetical protein [Acidisarcina polymorpha]AXC15901.1 hypothetical protein ACPOL_6689 [Acidisarcina polymorpha]
MKRKLNPKRLALMVIVGGFIAATGCFLPLAHIPAQSANVCDGCPFLWRAWPRILLLVPMALGLALSIWAERRFNRGLSREIWPDAELGQARALLAKRLWLWANLALAALWLTACLLSTHRGFLWSSFYILILTSVAPARMRRLLDPPVAPGSGLGDLRPLGPLQSEYWGVA